MSLRRRTLLTTSLMLLVLISAVLLAARLTILPTVEHSEQLQTERDVQRVLAVYAEKLSALDRDVRDWATWDDAYAFVEDGNAEFIQSNLVDQTFNNLQINVIAFVNTSGNIVFAKAYDLEHSEEIPQLAGLQSHIGADGVLLRQVNADEGVSGLLLLPEGPLMFVGRAILTSDAKSASRGMLMMGRFLDEPEVAHLQKVAQEEVAIWRLDDSQAVAPGAACALPSAPTPITVCPLSEERIAGFALLPDAYGQPALIVRVSEPRTTYMLAQTGMTYFFDVLLLVGIVTVGAVLLPLERYVLSRVARTSAEVSRIGTLGDFAQRVSADGSDELGVLSRCINSMLDALQESQRAVQERADELAALHNTALDISASRDLDKLLETIVERAAQLLKSPGGALYLCDAQQQKVRCVVSYNLLRDYRGVCLNYGEGAAGTVALRGEPLYIDDYRTWSGRAAVFEADRPFGAMLSAPLIWQGSTSGVIEVLAPTRHFSPGDLNLLSLLADQAAVAVENARLFGEVERLAITDDVTGIASRRQLFTAAEREFQRARRFERPLSLLMLDIDHFKQVNDSHGHSVGDQVLRGFAQVLKRNLREVDVLGRYGGEEFTLVLPETELAGAVQCAERIRLNVASAAIPAGRHSFTLTVSIGVAALTSETPDLASLVERADTALYAAKLVGRNRTLAG
jgi:diguanylate cyclase (GGDEF)-like protein